MTTVSQARVAPAMASRSTGRLLRRFGLHLVVVGLMVLWLLPTIGLLVNSFRPPQDVVNAGWWTALLPPQGLSFDNYAYVLSRVGVSDQFVNSLFIAIPSTIIPVFVAAFAAYAFAWMNFPFKNVVFVAIVGLLVIPLQTTFIPIQQLYKTFNLNGQFMAVWLAHTGYGMPFAIYLLRNFMGDLPREVFESADIDGAGPATKFFRLAVPMTIPAIASLAIFQFLFTWNDLLVALIYIGPSNAGNLPLSVGLANSLVSEHGAGWQYLASAAFVMMAVPLAVFLALQRYFVRGLTGGAVKG